MENNTFTITKPQTKMNITADSKTKIIIIITLTAIVGWAVLSGIQMGLHLLLPFPYGTILYYVLLSLILVYMIKYLLTWRKNNSRPR